MSAHGVTTSLLAENMHASKELVSTQRASVVHMGYIRHKKTHFTHSLSFFLSLITRLAVA